MADRITTAQLLNLADRAERGPLTADEARRLRAGIAALSTSKASIVGRLGAYTVQAEGRAVDDLKAVRRLVANSEQRGVSHIPVWAIAAASGAPISRRDLAPEAEQAREGA